MRSRSAIVAMITMPIRRPMPSAMLIIGGVAQPGDGRRRGPVEPWA